MSDIDVMAALIQKHAAARVRGMYDSSAQNYQCTDSSVKEAAQAIIDAGFVWAGPPSVEERLKELERRVTNIEGWVGR
jgi:hypothetical protein